MKSKINKSYLLFPVLDGDLLRAEAEYRYKEKETIKRIWKQLKQAKV